nr:hypothetical protein [Tanacetum cinerariifolium]
MVAFLSKPTESDGFEQIVDFLNAHPIRKPTRKDTQVPQPSDLTDNVVDEAVHKELGDSLVRAATTASSLEVEVLELETIKTTQHNEIASLKKRVKKLEKRNRPRTHKLKRLYKVGLTARVKSPDDEESLGEDASKQERRIDAIDADEEITLVPQDYDVSSAMPCFFIHVIYAISLSLYPFTERYAQPYFFSCFIRQETRDGLGRESVFRKQLPLNILRGITKGIVIQELGESTTTISKQQSQDKGKGIMIEEPVKPKKNDQIRLDEEAAKKLQAEFDEEEDLQEKKLEKNKKPILP